jgi:hypothetical protein
MRFATPGLHLPSGAVVCGLKAARELAIAGRSATADSFVLAGR